MNSCVSSLLPLPPPDPSLRHRTRAGRVRALLLTALVLPLSAPVVCADEIVAWGHGISGQVPSALTGTDFAAVAAGGYTGDSYNGYALKTDGSITAWGVDTYGQVSSAPTGTGFTAIAGGANNGYALAADGSISVWGLDHAGQISNAPTGTGFTAIASTLWGAGYALAADGSISAWGNDNEGSVFNAPTGAGFTAIANGYTTGYALTADGSIVAWGDDHMGMVSLAPTGTGFTAIAGGDINGFALAADGSISAWGSDAEGLVSNAPTGTGFTAIAAGRDHAYALAADGSIVTWGSDTYGPTGTGFTAIAAGWNQAYALRPATTVTAQGSAVSIRDQFGTHVGSGTVINACWVLTSANAARNAGGGTIPVADPSLITVEAGDCTLGLGTLFGVKAVHFFDPGFTEPWETTGDLALIQLSEPMPLGAGIEKAPAIASSANNPGGTSQATGWWKPCAGCPVSQTCLDLTLPILSDTDAVNAWGPNWPVPYQPASMLAVQDSTGLGGTFCAGSDGAGVFSGGTLVGVASWGASDCQTTYPHVLARVGAFRTWIDSTIAGATAPNHWPSVVEVLENGVHVGSGVLIESQYVLTASQLIQQHVSNYTVVVSDASGGCLPQGSVPGGQVHTVKTWGEHPAFMNSPSGCYNYGFGVLELDSPVANPGAAVMMRTSPAPLGAGATMVSWAGPGQGHVSSDIVLDASNCGFAPSNLSLTNAGGQVACTGEPGSGIFVEQDGCWELAGIVSYGPGGEFCTTPSDPGMATDVGALWDWLYSDFYYWDNLTPKGSPWCPALCDSCEATPCSEVLVGDKDNFASSGDPMDTVFLRPEFDEWINRIGGNNEVYHGGQSRPFDTSEAVNWEFGHTFTGLPQLASASLTFHLRETSQPSSFDPPQNDSISVGMKFNGGVATSIWSSGLHTLELLAGGDGVWSGSDEMTITLDLAQLPGGAVTDILAEINAVGYLDIYVQDDTDVDFVELSYCEVEGDLPQDLGGGATPPCGAGCDSMKLRSVGGVPVIGNSSFGVEVVGTPDAGFVGAWLGFGAATPGFPAAGGTWYLPPVYFPYALQSAAGTAGCSGSALFPVGIPNDPNLTGFPLTVQGFFVCPSLAVVPTNAITFAIQ